jgi:integrase
VELQRNSPALGPLRGKDPLRQWVSLFARRDPERAKRYEYALALFLGEEVKGKPPDWVDASYFAAKSPSTIRAYRFAVAEFFEFLAAARGRVVPPHEVTRKDAFDYAEWLGNRGRGALHGRWNFGVDVEKLKDGDTPDELAIYETVLRLGSQARFSAIARGLPPKTRRAHSKEGRFDEEWLRDRLRFLIMQSVLERSPKMVELRRVQPRAGLDPENPIDPDTFLYMAVRLEPVSRATIDLRLTACSSFWRVMCRGENAGQKALLEYDVFEDALGRVRKGLGHSKRVSAAERRPTPALLRRLIQVADGPRLVDKRNVALLWFLLLTGGRITEALNLRRGPPRSEYERKTFPGWLELGPRPIVVFLGKGNKRRRVQLPRVTLEALMAFWAALRSKIGPNLTRDEPGYRYRLLLEEPDAPLLPPISLWGMNAVDAADDWGYRRSLRRPAVSMLLCRLARRAGMSEAERRRIHPHGFRHAAAEGLAKGGVPLEQIKEQLGHESVTTTEQYLPQAHDEIHPSGEDEILEWLSEGTTRIPEHPIPPPQPDVTTFAEEEQPPVADAEFEDVEGLEEDEDDAGEDTELERAAARPTHLLPEAPAPPERPYALAEPERPLIAVGAEEAATSPPSPLFPYEELARGRKPRDLVWSGKPQARFLADHYAALPARFGLGSESLLVWWNKDAPSPWPVLAPAQAYPEVAADAGLLQKLERLYDRWARSEPTRTLALARWFYFLGNLTVGLEERIAGEYSWVGFGAVGRVGEDLRAHDEDWLGDWFEKNAHTFQVAERRFRAAPMPYRGESRSDFWARAREDIGAAGLIPQVPELPVWFWEKDPVAAIYERDPAEWKAFVEWLAALTGGSEVRDLERREQVELFDQERDDAEARAEGLLQEFYSLVDEAFAGDATAASSVEALRAYFKKEYGLTLPERGEGARDQRIAALLRRIFPDRPPPPTTNVLGDSRLFDPRGFRIERHTIAHSAEFRAEFAEENDGRDSECVMRRVARALWERVRPWQFEGVPATLTAAEERRGLFVTQLAQLAFVVPCPADVEARMVAEGYKAPSPEDLSRYINERIARAAAGKDDVVDEVASDVLETYYSEVEPTEPKLAAAVARARDRAGEQQKRKSRVAKRKLQQNARAALPHPLRLVAASFWPT